MKRRIVLALVLAVAALGVLVPGALADAVVQVRLVSSAGQAVEGTVTLTTASGATASCRTQGGSCTMRSVPGGRATVTVAPSQGAAPPPRPVMIPPSGNVSLIVNTPGR